MNTEPSFPTSATSADPTLIELMSALLRRRLVIIRLALAFALIGALLALMAKRTYTAEFSFTPQEASSTNGLSAIASDFGLNIGQNAAQSPEFYQSLLGTKEILWRLLETKFTVASAKGPVTFALIDSVMPKGGPLEQRRERATKTLRGDILSRIDQKTSVVGVSVKSWSADLSAQMARQIIVEINRFNTETRRSRAAAQREFAAQRVAETHAALRSAEDREEAWAIKNKIFAGSPELLFEKSRLDRDLSIRDQEYTAMMQQFNLARMEEVRNLPVITIIEKPVVPAERDPRGLVSKTVLGGFLGAVIGILGALLFESFRRSRALTAHEVTDLRDVRAQIIDELRHPLQTAREVMFLSRSKEQSPPVS